MHVRRWLTPGIGVKRWLAVVFAGLFLLAVAGAHVLRQLGRDLEPGSVGALIVDALTLQFLPYPVRGLVVGLVGLGLIALGAMRVIRAVTEPLRDPVGRTPLVEVLVQKRLLARGPRVVAIGGGTGLSALLRGLKLHTGNLTAIVTVADDGGSSGALRTELGIPPVGDIRNCIAALADAEPLMADLLQYRFPSTPREPGAPGAPVEIVPGALGGHAVGNLILAALTALEGGDFEEGVRRMNRVLAVRGQVLPVSPTPITLHARTRDGRLVDGQSRVMATSGIEAVWITPPDVAAAADALAAIADAELVILGPGSLYTSLLPVLLVPGVRNALAATAALRVYACNVASQTGETAGLDLADHVEAIERAVGPRLIDVVLANDRFDARRPPSYGAEAVRLRWPPATERPPRLVLEAVVDPVNAHRHDPERLAEALLRVLERDGGAHRRGAAARTA